MLHLKNIVLPRIIINSNHITVKHSIKLFLLLMQLYKGKAV